MYWLQWSVTLCLQEALRNPQDGVAASQGEAAEAAEAGSTYSAQSAASAAAPQDASSASSLHKMQVRKAVAAC
jgi:hypothetical protein